MDRIKITVEKNEDAEAEASTTQCQSCDAAGSPPSLTTKQAPDEAGDALSPLAD